MLLSYCQTRFEGRIPGLLGHMESGQRLKVSSDRLVKPGIKPATPGLQGKRFIHYTTAAPGLLGRKWFLYEAVNGCC